VTKKKEEKERKKERGSQESLSDFYSISISLSILSSTPFCTSIFSGGEPSLKNRVIHETGESSLLEKANAGQEKMGERRGTKGDRKKRGRRGERRSIDTKRMKRSSFPCFLLFEVSYMISTRILATELFG
jgi:hypothetical protein